MRDLACLDLQEQDFPILAAACGGDVAFPSSWAEWQARIAAVRAQAPDTGPLMALDVRDFITWCHRLDVLPCLAALRAYAILQRPENRAKRYGSKWLHSDYH